MAIRIVALSAFAALAVLTARGLAAEADPLSEQQEVIAGVQTMGEAYFRGVGPIDTQLLAAADAALSKTSQALFARGDFKDSANGLIRRALVRGLLADRKGQIVLLSRALQLARKADDRDLEAQALGRRAEAKIELAQFGEALDDATNAVRIASASGTAASRALALSALGHAQRAQGDVFAATETAQREIAAASQATDRMTLYYAYQSEFSAYMEIMTLCRSVPRFEQCSKALDIAADAQGRVRAIATELGYLGLVKSEQTADTRIALARMELAELRKSSVGSAQHPKTAKDVWSNERIVPIRGSLTPEAIATLDQDAGGLKQLGPYFRQDNPDVLFSRGFAREQEGRHDEALEWYEKATKAVEQDRGTLGDDHGRAAYMASRNKIFQATALQYLQRKRYAEAFDALERSRSRVLADMLASRPPQLTDHQGQTLYSEVAALRDRVAQDQTRLFTIGGLDKSRAHDDDYAAATTRLREDEAEYQKVLARLAKESPRLYSLAAAPSADFAQLQRAMQEENFETLQYLMTASGLVVWHTSAKGSYARSVLVTRSQLVTTIDALTSSLRDPKQAFKEVEARELFLFLVGPVLTQITPGARLVIIPSDEMANLPFQVLVDPNDGAFMGERFKISYAPSGTVLLGLRRSLPLGSGSTLALADPELRGGKGEIESIRRAVGGHGIFDSSHKPREADVKHWVADADIIHLAVHGDFSKADAMSSFLDLTASDGDDGRLSAMEMLGLPLTRRPFVALSGCETGLSALPVSGEMLGMTRALLFAGANGLLLSQWRVDSDATAQWMQAFYGAAVSKPPAEAAQIASARLLADPKTRHPYFWAAFLLTAR